MTGAAIISRIALLVFLGLCGSFPLSSLHAESGVPSNDGHANTGADGAPAPAAAATGNGSFRVDAGAFRSEENARSRCEPLIAKGFPLAVVRGLGGQGRPLFFCRSPLLMPHADAQAVAARLRTDESLRDVMVTWEQGAGMRQVKALPQALPVRHAARPQPEKAREAIALDPALKADFEQFMSDRDSALEYSFRADFERFMAERGATPPEAAPATQASDRSPAGQKPKDPGGDRPAPPLAAATAAVAATSAGRGIAGSSSSAAATALGGNWCGELTLYKGLAPQTWEFLAAQRVRIRFPVVAGASRGAMRSKEENVELTPDRRVRLVSDGDIFRSEAVYEIDGPRLRGVSYRRVDKRTGEERNAVPDTLTRCGGDGMSSSS
jgi:hypothetical protein